LAAPPRPPPPLRVFGPDAQRNRVIQVVNARPPGLRDLYHALLRNSWGRLFLFVAAVFLLINALFGLAFFLVGGVANARPESYLDHFFFSVQTFGTIGYGAMYPQGPAAEVVVTVEALASLFLNAMVTGLAFAKFARPTARLLWSNRAVLCDRDGVPTLMFRVANERRNHVVEATVRAAVLKSETTREGESLRRVVDLPLLRSSSPTFILTWTVLHPVTRDSPFHGLTPEALLKSGMEVVLTLTGLDETLGQTINDRTSFLASEVVYGATFADVIQVQADGRRVLDYGRFHELKPAKLSWEALGVTPP
jgi:inward rectifier potassium channel